jgi:F-type H+-transporting ATPase subunit b
MRSWLVIGVVGIVLGGALPVPLHAAGGHGDRKMEKAAKAWSELPKEKREETLAELTRNLPDKDRHAVEEFFKSLDRAEKEHEKAAEEWHHLSGSEQTGLLNDLSVKTRRGVETGLFKGAIEVSLWTILVFLLLMIVLRRFAWGPIMEGLNKREQSIARDKHEAELARKEATDLRNHLEAERARAHEEIHEIIAKARQDAEKVASEELARGKAELQSERQRLFNDVRVAQDHALREIWGQTAQVATLISAKAIHKNLTEADHRALVGEALEEFRAAAAKRKAEGNGSVSA